VWPSDEHLWPKIEARKLLFPVLKNFQTEATYDICIKLQVQQNQETSEIISRLYVSSGDSLVAILLYCRGPTVWPGSHCTDGFPLFCRAPTVLPSSSFCQAPTAPVSLPLYCRTPTRPGSHCTAGLPLYLSGSHCTAGLLLFCHAPTVPSDSHCSAGFPLSYKLGIA